MSISSILGTLVMFTSGFNKSRPNNIYNSADMAVHIFDDPNNRQSGVAIDWGIIRGKVMVNV